MADLFSIFSEATKRTAKNPIPTCSSKRSEEIRSENIQALRQSATNPERLKVQNTYDTPKTRPARLSEAFPNSRTGEEKVQKNLAERNAAADPNSQARHPSPHTPLCAGDEKKIDLATIFNRK